MTISRNLSILAEGANSSGVLGAAYGGTGLSTPGTSGNVLTSNGTGWVSSAPTGGGGGSGGGLSTSSVTLTSASGGAQAMAPTTYGQYFKLPDATTMSSAGAGLYNLSNTGGYYITIYDSASNIIGFIAPYSTVVVGLSSTSSATGNWILSNHELLAPTAVFNSSNLFSNNTPISLVILDSNRSLFVFAGPTNTYGLVYDQTAGFGSLTLLVASATIGVGLLIGTNKVLIAAASGTSFSAVVLSVSGTSITVNTVATSTLPNGPTGGSFYQIIAVGTTYVVNYRASGGSILYILGMTVSGNSYNRY